MSAPHKVIQQKRMEFPGILQIVLLVSSLLMFRIHSETDSSGCEYPAIYNFGDSNSDTGGIAAAFYPMGPPCGETYFHRPSGRGSDGRIIIDFIAEHLRLPHLSAYLASIGNNYRHGANFATGGATITRQNEAWFENGVSPFSLDIQVEHYTQFKTRTAYFYNQAKDESERSRLPRPEDFSKAIYTFDIGQNDIGAFFRKNMTDEEIAAAIPEVINQFAAQIQAMYDRGARILWIHSTGPFGCMPIATVRVKNQTLLDEHGCYKNQNEIALKFNQHLKFKVIQLRKELSEATLTYVDMYKAKYELITNAKNHGFEDPFKICCGYHDQNDDVWCGNKGIIKNGSEIYAGSCSNPSAIISWDSVHYTEAANHWIANRIVNGSFSDPPLKITQACRKLD